MTENTNIRRLSRSLKDKTNSLKKWVEEVTEEVDSIVDLVKEKEEKINKLESSSQHLLKINEELRMKIMDMSSKVSPLRKQPVDARRKSIFTIAEEKSERVLACEFCDAEDKDEKNRASQRDMWKDMKGQVTKLVSQIITSPAPKEMTESDETLPEGDEREAMEEMLLRSKQAKLFSCFWDVLKIGLGAVVCFGLCIGLILLYAYFFNNDFIANTLLLLLNDHHIAELTQVLSPPLTWKNNGLLPF